MWQCLLFVAVGEAEKADGMGHRGQWGLLRDAELIQVFISMVSCMLKIEMQ